jgi:hypothetical protein
VVLVAVCGVLEYVPLEERIVVPAYVVTAMLLGCLLGRAERQLARLRGAAGAATAIVFVSTTAAGAALIRDGVRGYPGFATHAWRNSQAIEVISRLPPSTRLYSNFPEAIYSLTGRPARVLLTTSARAGRPDASASERRARVVDEVGRGEAVIVLFTRVYRPPDPIDVTLALGTQPAMVLADALVYGREPAVPASSPATSGGRWSNHSSTACS